MAGTGKRDTDEQIRPSGVWAGVPPYGYLLAILAVGCAVIHFRSLGGGFFADDYLFLEQVRGRSLLEVLASPDPLGNFFRPLGRQVWFWVLSRAGNESPVPFHIANLCLLLASMFILFRLARRLGGGDAASATAAAAFFALHYAADVPVQWASGSQDLLAVLLGLCAVDAHIRGRRLPAAVSLVAALLAKESVGLVCVVAVAAGHAPGQPLFKSIRGAVLMIAGTMAWAVWWLSMAASRQGSGTLHAISLGDVAAGLVHLLQVAVGLELREGGSAIGHWSAAACWPGILAASCVWLATLSKSRSNDSESHKVDRARLLRTGAVWSLAGAVPPMLVIGIWSGYYYLFALAGTALVVAAATARLPRSIRPLVIGALVILSANTRRLDEFSTSSGAWHWQSHVNRHYLDRATSTIQGYLQDLRAARPSLPRRSTVFFADVPVSIGWQAADGPLIRWAYRDTSLRSYFLTQFTEERFARGPVFYFAVDHGHLLERSDMLPSLAYSALLADKPTSALAALNALLKDASQNHDFLYWRAWARLDVGDTAGAMGDLRAVRIQPNQRLSPADTSGLPAPADSAARYTALVRLRDKVGLDPWVHARLASLCLAQSERQREGVIEAYAFRVLSPHDPDAWRKWSAAQLAAKQYAPALRSLERYVELAGEAGESDTEARDVMQSLRRVLGGDIAHEALRNSTAGRAPAQAQ